MVRAFGINAKVGGSSPFRQDIFCLKNFDTFTRTPIRVSKINVVSCAQLTFQMLTLLQKIIQYALNGAILLGTIRIKLAFIHRGGSIGRVQYILMFQEINPVFKGLAH